MKFTITSILLTMLFSSVIGQTSRTIYVAGLIVNSATLSPIENASIYDKKGNILGTSDSNGYYKVSIAYASPGDIKFVLKISKDGYKTFTEYEHWGNLSNPKDIINFGLAPKGTSKKAFSKLGSATGTHDLGYENVLRNFKLQIDNKQE